MKFRKAFCGIQKQLTEIQIEKEEVKPSMFADNMILYTEDPNDDSRKLLELINEFSKFAEYKTNTQKSTSVTLLPFYK